MQILDSQSQQKIVAFQCN